MKNAIILHGMPSQEEYYDPNVLSMSNLHWIPWLQSAFIKQDIHAVTPEVPFAFRPQWDLWVREVERFEMNSDTILVGHSCGGGFWLRYLSERKDLKVGRLVLVAPWLDPDGDETDGFFEFDLDPNLIKRTAGITLFHSDNDMGNVHKSVAQIRDKLPGVTYREFKGYGHFTESHMGGSKFPELLEAVVK